MWPVNKFDVIKLARKSDVESRFNATSLGAVTQTQTGMESKALAISVEGDVERSGMHWNNF